MTFDVNDLIKTIQQSIVPDIPEEIQPDHVKKSCTAVLLRLMTLTDQEEKQQLAHRCLSDITERAESLVVLLTYLSKVDYATFRYPSELDKLRRALFESHHVSSFFANVVIAFLKREMD